MSETVALAMAQINPVVGDIAGNCRRILEARRLAGETGADLVVFPELTVCGYPPEDLVRKPFFQDRVRRAVEDLARATGEEDGPALLIGAPWADGGRLYNAALLLDGGDIAAIRYKVDLPNYGPFDEKRVFNAGDPPGPVMFRGVRLGVMVCEDMWTGEVAETLEESGAEILVVINGSPFETGKGDERLQLALSRVTETGLPLIYVNQVGGQDELVFDGTSFALDAGCRLVVQAHSFRQHLVVSRWTRDAGSGGLVSSGGEVVPPLSDMEMVYQALRVGVRDYVDKNGFPGVLIGLSGGIDSALTAAIAVDALGPERVHCVMMPSPYTSRESLDDAEETAEKLGVRLDSIPIGPAMDAFTGMFADTFAGREADITEENIQSRCRGITLMALSNKFGNMVLSTGNKSEMSVGYATLYGDMCGGYSALKDVYKTMVFQLCQWRNGYHPVEALGPPGVVIPRRVIDKPPTAELRPDQKDEDSLPPYEKLDDILMCLIEREMGFDEIVGRGHDSGLVNAVWRMLDGAEYKRRQAPPGVKITRRSFGRDRRYPITNRFKDIVAR